jgi:hypothetical protein
MTTALKIVNILLMLFAAYDLKQRTIPVSKPAMVEMFQAWHVGEWQW